MTKPTKRKMYLMVALIVLVTVFASVAPCTFALAATQEDPFAQYFSGGSGSYDNPYLITNATELDNIRKTVVYDEDEGVYCTYRSFKLVNNIYISRIWQPIHGEFGGHLFGNNKTIYSILLRKDQGANCGFVEHNVGEIRDVTFQGAKMFDTDNPTVVLNLGVIAGINSGTVTNCKVYGEINVDSYTANIGGIAGSSNYGMIVDCENYANVTGSGNIGGIVGYSYGTTIYNCKNGITDENTSNGIITYEYNTQNGCAAGIVGKAEGNTYLKYCANYGKIVYGSEKKVGDSSIQPCMAQIVGWAVSITKEQCSFQGTDLADYTNLYKGVFVNQKKYCSEEQIGREGN